MTTMNDTHETTVETALRSALPRGAYLHATGDSFEYSEHFPGGKIIGTVNRFTGAWRLAELTWSRRPPGSTETGVASGPDLDGFARAFAAHLDARTNGTPVVGEGATFIVATDHHACTVERVDMRNGKPWRVVLRRDRAKLLNGVGSGEPDALQFSPGGFCGHTSGTQRYVYEPDPAGATHTITRRELKGGRVRWVAVGHRSKASGLCAHSLGRNEHYDFNY